MCFVHKILCELDKIECNIYLYRKKLDTRKFPYSLTRITKMPSPSSLLGGKSLARERMEEKAEQVNKTF